MAAGLFDELDRYGERIALITEAARPMSYAALLAVADGIGQAIGARALVVVVCRNEFDCLAGYIGLMRAGAVPLLVHHSATAEQIAAIATEFSAGYVYEPQGGAGYVLRRTPYSSPVLADDLALLLTTSGSTGSRSLVRLSQGNLAANATAIAQYLAITPADRAITTMPMSYSYGLSIIHSHLIAGASVVLTEDSLLSSGFWPAVRDHRVTNFGGVPFIYDMLKRLRFERMELPHLRLLTQAGGKLGHDRIVEFSETCAGKGIDFVVMYGQTEATARIAYVPVEHAKDKAGSIGIAIPGGSLSLVDAAGGEISAADVAGELVYRGANVSLGYARCAADLGRGDDNRGLLHTGDIATRDGDGFYTLVGRLSRFVKVFGHRVNLDELEQMLGPDCACGGGDDDLRIYIPACEDMDRVRAVLAKTTLKPHGIKLIRVEAILRTASGKVDYPALRAANP